ncbi:hypothetical protein CMEL01_11632 [Colletotrichum melonis]|uniref:Uncharacterized protein n=1 Tax=Colletotrichum melonis TaxID=1209925 RepID=A0AAI9XZY1_9PEZI|nr:hypothetical protein CMEL01_11632 [Colletotrichum melonis]
MEKTDLELRPADPEGSVPRYLHAWSFLHGTAIVDWKPAEAYHRTSNSLLLPATPHGRKLSQPYTLTTSMVKSRPLFFTDYKPLKGGLMRRRRTAPTSIIRIQESGQLANTPGSQRLYSRCCGQFWHEDTQVVIYCVRNYEYAFSVLRSTAYGCSRDADGSLASVVYSTQYSASPVSVLTPLTSPISLHT